MENQSFAYLWQLVSDNQNISFDSFPILPLSPYPKQDALLSAHQIHNQFITGLDLIDNLIATGSEDGTLKIWNRSNFNLRAEFNNIYAVNAVLWLPESPLLATADDNNEVKIYHMNSQEKWEVLHVLRGHTDYVSKLACTKDKLISASKDGTLKIWDYKRGVLLKTLEGHKDWIYGLAVSPDGKRMISAALNSSLKVWDMETFELIKDLVEPSTLVYVMGLTIGGDNPSGLGNKQAPYGIAWLENGMVATLSTDIVLWDENKWEVIWHQELSTYIRIRNAVYLPAFNMLITASDKIRGWDINTGNPIFTESGHGGNEMYAIGIHGQKVIYTTDAKGLIKVWDVEELVKRGINQRHSGIVHHLFYDESTQLIVSSSFDNCVILYNQKAEFLKFFEENNGSCALLSAMLPDEPQNLLLFWSGILAVLNLETREIIKKIVFDDRHLIQFDSVIYLGNHRILGASLCYYPRIIDLKTGAITVLGMPYLPYHLTFWKDNLVFCDIFNGESLDRKEEIMKTEHPPQWKNLTYAQTITRTNETPFLLLDAGKLEVLYEFWLPEGLLEYEDEKTKRYAMELVVYGSDILFALYTNLNVVVWDLTERKILRVIKRKEEIQTVFFGKDKFYFVSTNGYLYIYDSKTYIHLRSAPLGITLIHYCMDTAQNLLFYSSKSTLAIMDLKTCEIKMETEMGFEITEMIYADQKLILGTNMGEVFSFEYKG